MQRSPPSLPRDPSHLFLVSKMSTPFPVAQSSLFRGAAHVSCSIKSTVNHCREGPLASTFWARALRLRRRSWSPCLATVAYPAVHMEPDCSWGETPWPSTAALELRGSGCKELCKQ